MLRIWRSRPDPKRRLVTVEIESAPPGGREAGKAMRYRVTLQPSESTCDSVLAFSHVKAGSTLLNGLLQEIAQAAGVTFVSIPGELFRMGIDPRAVEIEADFPRVGYCFGGFRFFPGWHLPLIDTARIVLLVRDPRDAVVSHYFSIRDSHPLPPKESALYRSMLARREEAKAAQVDDWVMNNVRGIAQTMTNYVARGFLGRPNVLLCRYEDVIYRKRAWVDDMLSWYGWSVRQNVVDRIVRTFDTFPLHPDPARHVRQVHPGNHRQVLKSATCAALDEKFAEILDQYGYRSGNRT